MIKAEIIDIKNYQGGREHLNVNGWIIKKLGILIKSDWLVQISNV